jgi:hypothetical protein
MSQDTPHRIVNRPSPTTANTQEIVPQNGSNGVLNDSDASQAIVQCLLVAARRGRQIRLAREQAAQSQQNGSAPAYEGKSQCDGT